jgi:hypothetical protein
MVSAVAYVNFAIAFLAVASVAGIAVAASLLRWLWLARHRRSHS